MTWRSLRRKGIDSIADEMVWLGEAAGETADEMLLAGAEEVKRAWQETAEAHGYHDSGDMIASIRADKAPKSDANGVRKMTFTRADRITRRNLCAMPRRRMCCIMERVIFRVRIGLTKLSKRRFPPCSRFSRTSGTSI